MEERKLLQQQKGGNSEQDTLARARELLGEGAKPSTEPDTPVADVAAVEKTNSNCEITPIKEFLQRGPKPKK